MLTKSGWKIEGKGRGEPSGGRGRQGEPDLSLSPDSSPASRRPPPPACFLQTQTGLEGLPNQVDQKRSLLPTVYEIRAGWR